MKVKELIDILVCCDENALVVIGIDAASDEFNILNESILTTAKYVAQTSYCGEVYDTSKEDPEEYYDLDEYTDALVSGVNAVVLYPVD